MKLVEGVYESLISTAIAEKLQRDFPDSSYHVEKETIDSAESHTMLAQYLADIVSVVLKEYFRDKKEVVTISKQVECVNKILQFIENESSHGECPMNVIWNMKYDIPCNILELTMAV